MLYVNIRWHQHVHASTRTSVGQQDRRGAMPDDTACVADTTPHTAPACPHAAGISHHTQTAAIGSFSLRLRGPATLKRGALDDDKISG